MSTRDSIEDGNLIMGGLASLFIQMPSWVLFLILMAVLLTAVRQYLLPKPIPGIPYNPESARRILGDIPDMKKVAGRRQFLAAQCPKLGSPIVQMFFIPGGRPIVVVSDYHEYVDICLRRTKEFGRSWLAKATFGSVEPDHHISMKSSEPRYKRNKELIRDLMTPSFLHEVAAPRIFNKVLILIETWKLKTKLSNGSPFCAKRDIWSTTLDAIMAASFGFDDSQSAMRMSLDYLKENTTAILASQDVVGASKGDTAAIFPELPIPEELQAFVTVANSLGFAFQSAFPRLGHWWYRQTTEWKKATKLREQLVCREIENALGRLRARNFLVDDHNRNAIDYMLSREKKRAAREGRDPDYTTHDIHAESSGFLLAGHDTVSTTLQWGVKRLASEQTVQVELRRCMHRSWPQAVAEKRNPTANEILRTPLPMLDAVVEEVLRLAQTVPLVVRDAIQDTTILGYTIPKDTMVFLLSHSSGFLLPALSVDESRRTEAAQRPAARVGEWDPTTVGDFIPKRWLKVEMDEEKKVESVVYDPNAGPSLPFSIGQRGCFGKRLAYLELRLLIALLVWNFEFLPLTPEMNTFTWTESLTTLPNDCFVKLRSTQP